MDYLKIAKENQQKAKKIVAESGVEEIWQKYGAKVNLVGSLAMGLLMKHKDIDFHIYTDDMDVAKSFSAVAEFAQSPKVKKIEFANLLDTEDACLEWHAWYEYSAKDVWQIDMIHIRKASKYDGYFEKVAECIKNMMTEEQKKIILRLKYATPDEIKIPGIQYYKAVIKHHIHNYADFEKWCIYNPLSGIEVWPLETD